MNLQSLLRNWKSTLSANVMMAGSIAGLVYICVSQQQKISSTHERIVLIPPMMNKEATVGWNEVSQNYYEGWGVYLAKMLGSATPGTARFTADHIKFLFQHHNELYETVKTQLLSIEKDPAYTSSGSINEFSPKFTAWEASTNTLYVSGYLKTTAYRTNLQTLANVYVTYQITMKMVEGTPDVEWITSYAGQPRTAKYMREHPAEATRIEKEAQAKAGLIIPEESDIQRAIEAGEGSVGPQPNVTADGDQVPANPKGKKTGQGRQAMTSDQEGGEDIQPPPTDRTGDKNKSPLIIPNQRAPKALNSNPPSEGL